jgi:hypothetical protein
VTHFHAVGEAANRGPLHLSERFLMAAYAAQIAANGGRLVIPMEALQQFPQVWNEAYYDEALKAIVVNAHKGRPPSSVIPDHTEQNPN